ncbi:MAG: hypothetical protein QOC81_816 [Thermoanaerobaculia bacterium]|jgi:hypothetical protein|nr:hypothetical protein [Thermoanaerobaculia bacterium]
MEVNVSEAQGGSREASLKEVVEQNCESMNKNGYEA